MNSRQKPDSDPLGSTRSSRFILPALAFALLVVLLGLFSKRSHKSPADLSTSSDASNSASVVRSATYARGSASRRQPGYHTPATTRTAQEIVATRLIQFGKMRRDLAYAIAEHHKVEVPSDVDRFFAAVEGGRWEEIDAAHQALLAPGQGLNQPRSPELHQIWRPIQEAWGAAREAHNWPAQKLLDYGSAILDALSPGTIYVGGTDPGCFIPTMLNETTDGERHITLTQNALADMTYLNYLQFQYADRMSTLTEEDSQRAFQEYVADAQKRLEHDRQFPDEPKQIKPGEDVKMVDNKPQVSGQVAVMGINEKLFQILMDKNPNASFAIEESFPFASMSAGATTLGPVMELRADGPNGLTADRAAQSLDYWRSVAQQLLSDPEVSADSDPLKAYSKLVASQAGLLQDHKLAAEAEQAYRIAIDLYPSSPEAVFRYVNLLMGQGRMADAVPIAENAAKAAPNNRQFQDLLDRLKKSPAGR